MFDDNERIVCTMLVLGRISLACRCCLQKNIFSNPHACNKVFVLMIILRNRRIGYLTTTPGPGHPHWPGSNHWTPPPQSSHLLLVRQIWFPPQIDWSHTWSLVDYLMVPRIGPIISGQSHFTVLTLWGSLTQRGGYLSGSNLQTNHQR